MKAFTLFKITHLGYKLVNMRSFIKKVKLTRKLKKTLIKTLAHHFCVISILKRASPFVFAKARLARQRDFLAGNIYYYMGKMFALELCIAEISVLKC